MSAEQTGKTTGRAPLGISVRVEPLAEQEVCVDEAQASESVEQDRFELVMDAAREFRQNMSSLWHYTAGVGRAVQSTGLVNLAELSYLVVQLGARDAVNARPPLAKLVIDREFKENDETKKERLEFPIKDHADYNLCCELAYSSSRALRLLHQSTLQQIVVLFERLLGEIVFHATLADPDNAYLEDQLSVREILEMDSFSRAKEAVAYRQTEQFLRDSSEQKLQFFQKRLKVDLYRLCKSQIPTLLECIIRRHAIVHGTSFSSHEYWRKRETIKGLPSADKSEDVAEPSARYISDTWQTVCGVGIIAAHATLCRIAASSKNDEHKRSRTTSADAFLTTAAYECIRLGRYRSAEDILRYYLDEPGRTSDVDTHRLIAKVNLAQTLKWSKKEDEAKQQLDRLDVASLNTQFQLCVAALREDNTLFQQLLPKVVSEGLITIPDLLEWPVFRSIRRHNDFRAWIASAFGVAQEAIPESRFAPLVLGPTPERIEPILKKMTMMAQAMRLKEAKATAAEGANTMPPEEPAANDVQVPAPPPSATPNGTSA